MTESEKALFHPRFSHMTKQYVHSFHFGCKVTKHQLSSIINSDFFFIFLAQPSFFSDYFYIFVSVYQQFPQLPGSVSQFFFAVSTELRL